MRVLARDFLATKQLVSLSSPTRIKKPLWSPWLWKSLLWAFPRPSWPSSQLQLPCHAAPGCEQPGGGTRNLLNGRYSRCHAFVALGVPRAVLRPQMLSLAL